MNCIEALNNHVKSNCEACIVNALIIEFKDLPEERKPEFDYYDKNEHFLLYCHKCQVYKILPDPVDEVKLLL